MLCPRAAATCMISHGIGDLVRSQFAAFWCHTSTFEELHQGVQPLFGLYSTAVRIDKMSYFNLHAVFPGPSFMRKVHRISLPTVERVVTVCMTGTNFVRISAANATTNSILVEVENF